MNKKNIKEDPREKLIKILEIFKENTSPLNIKLPKNSAVRLRKLYKYIKPNINLIKISFNDLEEIDKEKQ